MIVAFLGGIVLGIIFFGGLYWSIKKFDKVRYPAAFMSLSAMLRMAILLIGFYILMNGDIMNLLAALIGVLAVKFFMIFKIKE